MKLRTTAGAAALALAAALSLSACAGDDASSDAASESPSAAASSAAATEAPQPTAEDVAALKAVKVNGKAGKEPKLSYDTPFEVSAPTSRVVDEGDGAELTASMQVTMQYVAYDGDDKRLGSTWETDAPESFILGDANYGILTEPLTGQKVGARVLVANSAAGSDGTTQTVVNLVEITGAKKIPSRAEGETVKPAAGLPTVTLDDSGAPSITIPDGYKAPKKTVAQTLIKGDGPKVKEGQSVTVNYTGWTFDGKSFDSSWEKGSPASFDLVNGSILDGWVTGLPGQTVGSQVLLVIPADEAYADNPPEGSNIDKDAPLIFVVDILAAS